MLERGRERECVCVCVGLRERELESYFFVVPNTVPCDS